MPTTTEALRLALPDGSVREVSPGITPLQVAASIGPRLARDSVGADAMRSHRRCRSSMACATGDRVSRWLGRRREPLRPGAPRLDPTKVLEAFPDGLWGG
jgi:threonyl-tRNA synthetase